MDIREIVLNTKPDILLGNDFDAVVDVPTDTTIYSFNKMLQLLSSNNRFLNEKCIIVQKMYEKCNSDFQTYMVQYWVDAGMRILHQRKYAI